MPVKFVALTAHPVVILRWDTPTKEVEIRGRKTLVFNGESHKDWVLGTIPASGLPIPSVVSSSSSDEETHKELWGGIPVEIFPSGGKVINDLPSPEEGVIYITSSFTANEAANQGRRDVACPNQLICVLNADGTTTILGTIGLKAYK